jgi:uncharacterized protein YxeA
MKKILIVLIMAFALVGCEGAIEGDTNTEVTNYTAEAGGTVLILNNDGSKECYDLDANGSACNQETYIEIIFDGAEEAAEAEATDDVLAI